MEITWNQDTRTMEIHVHKDQVSDELIGMLPGATTTAEGCLAWSIRFGDVRRPSNNTSGDTDELLGSVGAIVGAISSGVRASSIEAEGKIRGTLILTLSNSPIVEESASTTIGTIRTTVPASDSLETIQRLQEEFALELNATEPQQISLGSSSVQAQAGSNAVTGGLGFSSDIAVSNMPTLLFANPFAG